MTLNNSIRIDMDILLDCLEVVDKKSRRGLDCVFIEDDEEGNRHYVTANDYMLIHACSAWDYHSSKLKEPLALRPVAFNNEACKKNVGLWDCKKEGSLWKVTKRDKVALFEQDTDTSLDWRKFLFEHKKKADSFLFFNWKWLKILQTISRNQEETPYVEENIVNGPALFSFQKGIVSYEILIMPMARKEIK